MEIKENRQDDRIILDISGRIDSTNSSQFQSAILLAFQKMNQIELDFMNVAYLSSRAPRADDRPKDCQCQRKDNDN